MNKKCKMCFIEKDITNFHIAKKGKFGRASRCKLCMKEKANEPNQIEMARKRRDKYYNKNKEKQSEKYKEVYKQNREVVIKRSKLWRENNKERSNEIKKKYIENNKNKTKKYFRDYQKKLRTNPYYRIKKNMSYAVWRALKNNKIGKSWKDLVSFSPEELTNHLESKFTEGMNWENYGKYGWHIDHIIPQSYFKFDSYDHPAFKACWDLSNLQPMWSNENLSKGNRVELTQDIKDFLDLVNQISV